MGYKRLSLMLFAQFIILLPLYFTGINILNGNYSYAIPFILLMAYFLYSLNLLRIEALKIKKDKHDGVYRETLILCNYDVLYKGLEKNNNMPPIPIATFKCFDSDEYMCLSGDYSQVNMVEGKKYKVKYYKSSGLLIDIENDYSRPKKVKVIKHSKQSQKSTYTKRAKFIKLSELPAFIEVLITLLIIGGPIFIILFVLYKLYKLIQIEVLMTRYDILLVQPSFLVWFFIFYGLAVFFLILFEKDNNTYLGFVSKIYFKLGFRKSLALVSIIFILLLTQLFSVYIKVSPDKIECKNGYFLDTQTYSWNSVEKSRIYFSSESHKYKIHIKLHYILVLKDGNTIELKNSDMFWDRILKVDTILQHHGITVDRGAISYLESINFILDEDVDFDSGLKVLNQIISVEGYLGLVN